jgi:NADPH-dependent 2,4-dienoyl-CoA reductase/sulfur reductase-like enzyme/pSer/pThr/pTyr-binding forkhead associated (FHA) protein
MAGQTSYVIIGNGITGVTAAEILRTEDSAAAITVIADDPFPVFYRPALKDYLAGRVREDKLWARSASFYQDRNIRFLPERVVRIQAGQHIAQLQSGREVGYTRLLLANGARASTLKCPGLDLTGVSTLRTVADYQAVLNRLGTVKRVVVSGSGTLALESIETLRHRGYQVTHLLRRSTLWSEVLDATASDLILQQERRDGVEVRLEEEIAEITGKQGQVSGVVTTRGTRIPCEMVLIAIGIEPIIDFVKSSGIGCGRGVKVDGKMRTNAPDIYAAGDILETTDTVTGRTRVIGQWYPAIQQARAAAYSMLDLLDTDTPFRASTFYNATFLYGLDFASVGLSNGQGYQEIIADPKPRTYQKVLLKDGVPVGVLSLGDRRRTLAFKRAIDHRVDLSAVASKLFADDFKLNDWLDSQGVPPPLIGVRRTGDAAIQQVAYAGGRTSIAVPATDGKKNGASKPPVAISEASLIPLTPPDQSLQLKETRLSQTQVMTIGRQVGVFLLIDHATISRRHAEISYANGQYLVHDLGSMNGTFVNEVRLQTGSVQALKPNDVVRFGTTIKFTFNVRTLGGEENVKTAKGARRGKGVSMAGITLHGMETSLHDPLAAALPQEQPILNADGSLMLPGAASPIPASTVATFNMAPTLIIVPSYVPREKQGPPDVYLLKQGKHITLGRDKSNEIPLADIVASRKHAEVFPGPDGFYIRDLESSNGVMVNQTKIDNPYLLSHGDRITIGSSRIYYIDLQANKARTALDVQSVAPPPQPVAVAQQPQLVFCTKCGLANMPIARFCAGCSAPLKQG